MKAVHRSKHDRRIDPSAVIDRGAMARMVDRAEECWKADC